MKYLRYGCLLAMTAVAGMCETPAGWKMIHDKSGACMASVPGDWKVDTSMTWSAYAPADNGDIQVVSTPGKTVKPLNEMAQKALSVAKMYDNTAQRVFFANEPTKSAKPLTPYHVSVAGKGGVCAALITVRAGVSEETVKKIAATVSGM